MNLGVQNDITMYFDLNEADLPHFIIADIIESNLLSAEVFQRPN